MSHQRAASRFRAGRAPAKAAMVALIVVSAAVAMPVPARAAGDDPASPLQWALHRVGADVAWKRTTGSGVRIGVVDTGIDAGHEDLAGRVVAATSCVGTAGVPSGCRGSGRDGDGHGTHVAGIAAAVRGNGKGGAGVAPDARLVVARVFSPGRVAAADDIVAGIKWVVDHGAGVVNLSLGDADMRFTPAVFAGGLRAGLDYAWTHGAVPVLASGHYGPLGVDLDNPAARTLHAVVVGATGPDDRVAPDSPPTGRANLAVLAPGGVGPDAGSGVFSSFWTPQEPNAYGVLHGTSMAAAHVSGVLALLLAEGYNGPGAVDRLLSTADGTVSCDMGSPNCWGLVDAARATEDPVEQTGA